MIPINIIKCFLYDDKRRKYAIKFNHFIFYLNLEQKLFFIFPSDELIPLMANKTMPKLISIKLFCHFQREILLCESIYVVMLMIAQWRCLA